MLVICPLQFTLKMMMSAATTTIILWSYLKLDAYHQLDFFVQAFFLSSHNSCCRCANSIECLMNELCKWHLIVFKCCSLREDLMNLHEYERRPTNYIQYLKVLVPEPDCNVKVRIRICEHLYSRLSENERILHRSCSAFIKMNRIILKLILPKDSYSLTSNVCALWFQQIASSSSIYKWYVDDVMHSLATRLIIGFDVIQFNGRSMALNLCKAKCFGDV